MMQFHSKNALSGDMSQRHIYHFKHSVGLYGGRKLEKRHYGPRSWHTIQCFLFFVFFLILQILKFMTPTRRGKIFKPAYDKTYNKDKEEYLAIMQG